VSGENLQICDVCGGEIPADSESPEERCPCPACGSSVWFDRNLNQQLAIVNAAHSLDMELLGRLADSGHVLVLDFTQMEQISSEVPARLLSFDSKLKTQGKRLRLCGFRPEILNLLSIAKLDAEFDIYPTAEDAITSL